MGLFDFSEPEFLTFFAVLVRISIITSVFPVLGEKVIPVPLKILLSLAITIVIFPLLVAKKYILIENATFWASSTGSLIFTIAREVGFALALGFVVRMIFEGIQIAGNICGTFMGFAAANTYDPTQEGNTQVVSKILTTLAMLIFLSVDGHHVMLSGVFSSFKLVGIGKSQIMASGFAEALIHLAGEVIRIGFQMAAPLAVSIFAVNVVYGVFAKAMPQLNVLVLSFSVSAMLGLIVLVASIPEFESVTVNWFDQLEDRMGNMIVHLSGK